MILKKSKFMSSISLEIRPQNFSFGVGNISFNEQACPALCSIDEANHLAIEILRMGWIISRSIEYKIGDSIGSRFLSQSWLNHPAWGSRQEAFNEIAKKVANFATCSAGGVFKNIQQGWRYLTGCLKNEVPAKELRFKIIPDSLDVGKFSDTPLVVSKNQFDFPNVVTAKEFKKINEIYEIIENGRSGMRIDEGDDFFTKSVLQDLRIILSTSKGRELIYSLYEKNILIEDGLDFNSYNPRACLGNKKGGEIFYSVQGGDKELIFGKSLGSDKVGFFDFNINALFHELTHAYHDLVIGDLKTFYLRKSYYEGNLWTNEDEKRTILITDEFQRELKEGEKNWFGRMYHEVAEPLYNPLSPIQSAFNFYPFKYFFSSKEISPERIKALLAIKLRIDENVTAADSIKEIYDTHIANNINIYFSSIAKGGHFDLIQYTLESTDLNKSLSAAIIGEAFENASEEGYDKIVKLLLDFHDKIEIPKESLHKALAKSILRGHDHIHHLIRGVCQYKELPPEVFFTILYGFSILEDKKSLQILLENATFDGTISDSTKIPLHLAPYLKTAYCEQKDNVVGLFIKKACLNWAETSTLPQMELRGLLLLAVSYGDAETVEIILNSKLNELTGDELGYSFLQSIVYTENRVLEAFAKSNLFKKIPIEYIERALADTRDPTIGDPNAHHLLLSSNRFNELSAESLTRSSLFGCCGDYNKSTNLILKSERIHELISPQKVLCSENN